jgi:naphthoate synthase/2-ketocyclohexanecarboxyl-CoA hydrolase
MDDVLYEVEPGIAWITLNRPQVRNALRSQTYVELTESIIRAEEDESVGVIVIQGQGDEAFSSGGDVKDQRGRTQPEGRIHLRKVLGLGTAMRNCGKPIVAAVRGYCIGGGHELHLFADLTVAADNATFGQVGPRVGMVPIWGATEILPRIVGEKRAREMLFTTRFYNAAEAEAMGLVNRVVPLAELEDAVRELCQTILEMSPQSLRIAKLSLNYAVDAMLPAFNHGAELVSMLYGSPEQMEGAASFLEKRKPNFRPKTNKQKG